MCVENYESRECEGSHEAEEKHESIEVENIHSSYTPLDVSGLTNVIQLAVGTGHVCALLSDHTVKCWGNNNKGQLGRGTVDNNFNPTPTLISGLTDVGQIVAKAGYTCALIRGTGKIKCWGDNNFGQLGFGSTSSSSNPTLSTLFSDIKDLFMGDGFSCILKTNNDFKCIGLNSSGNLGDNTTINRTTTLVDVFNGGYPDALGGGQYSACAIYGSTDIKCWGLNNYYQLGDGTNTNRSAPVSVRGL